MPGHRQRSTRSTDPPGLEARHPATSFERSAMVAYVIENETVVIARIFYRGRNYLKLLQ